MSATFYRYFFQGMHFGARHFGSKGVAAAGLKRAIGFILQPVENWTRYGEFHLAERLLAIQPGEKILDLGSPKMFGLLLARRYPATFHLTDLWTKAVGEVSQLYEQNRELLRGTVRLETADATKLTNYADGSFDQIYTISVLEHIESLPAIQQSFRAMARVLAPHGRVLVTVPVAPQDRKNYQNNEVYGRQYQGEPLFFFHEFSVATLRSLVAAEESLAVRQVYFLPNGARIWYVNLWNRIPQKVRGCLGLVNLLIAFFATRMVPMDWERLQIEEQGDIVLLLQKK